MVLEPRRTSKLKVLSARGISYEDSRTLEEAEEAFGGGFDDDPLAGDEGFVWLTGDSAELDVAAARHAIGGIADATGEIEDMGSDGDNLHAYAGGWVGFGENEEFLADGGLLLGKAFGLVAHDAFYFLAGGEVVLLDDEANDGLSSRHYFTSLVGEISYHAVIGGLEEAVLAALLEKSEATIAGTFVLADFGEASDGTREVVLHLGNEFGLHGAALFEDGDLGLQGTDGFPVHETAGEQPFQAFELTGKDI